MATLSSNQAMDLYKQLGSATVSGSVDTQATVTMNGYHQVLSVSLPLLSGVVDQKTLLALEQSLAGAFNQAIAQVTTKATELMAENTKAGK